MEENQKLTFVRCFLNTILRLKCRLYKIYHCQKTIWTIPRFKEFSLSTLTDNGIKRPKAGNNLP